MDEKVTWNPTCSEMENVWWSFGCCGKNNLAMSNRLSLQKNKVVMLEQKYNISEIYSINV
jgi:hypothetical protein